MADFELVSFNRGQLRVRHAQGHELVFSILTDVWGARQVSAGPLVAVHGGPDPAWKVIDDAFRFSRDEAKRLKLCP